MQTGSAFFAFGGASVLTVGGQVKVIQHKIPKIQGGFAQKAFFLAHQLHRLFASQKAAPGFLCAHAMEFKHTLLRFMVGVGLCSTRGALRQHRALAGEQCSPLR